MTVSLKASRSLLVGLSLALFSPSAVHGQSSSIRTPETQSHQQNQPATTKDDRPVWEALFETLPTPPLSSQHLRRATRSDTDKAAATKMEQTTQVFVKYKNEQGRQDALGVAKSVLHEFDDDYIALTVDREGAKLLFDDDNIETLEADSLWTEQGELDGRVVRLNSTRSGRSLSEQTPYGISMTQADQVSVGPSPVEVCIVDTGLALGHPDFVRSRLSGASRRSNMDNTMLDWREDYRGHGTHVAGTISAQSNNGVGVRGMGDISVYITRGLNNQGTAWESDVREAMEQCRTRGAKIISLSLAGGSMSTAMDRLVDSLHEDGFLILAAAGNKGQYYEAFPAGHPRVISVAAVREDAKYWPGSNYGPWLEISAPGHKVLSTTVDRETGTYLYAEYSGTSMATPHVAGAAALLWSHYPTCTNDQIRYALMYTSQDVGAPGCDNDYGYGILKVKDALTFLAEHDCHAGTNWGQTNGRETGRCDTVKEEPEEPMSNAISIETATPSDEPTPVPTRAPTRAPTPVPTVPFPTPRPTPHPTDAPRQSLSAEIEEKDVDSPFRWRTVDENDMRISYAQEQEQEEQDNRNRKHLSNRNRRRRSGSGRGRGGGGK